MKTVFFTICDTALQKPNNKRNLDFAGFVNSFKKFHPEIEIKVFTENDLAKHGLNFYNAKASFGKLLSNDFDLVVNVDADHYFFDRCEEILKGDYDVACPACFNMTYNIVGIKVSSGLLGEAGKNWLIDEKNYLHAGLIASTNKNFWNHFEYVTMKYYKMFHCYENDTLNLAAHLYPYNVKFLDGDCDYEKNLRYYGSSSLGKEGTFYIENDKIMCEGKPVIVHHFGHGMGKRLYTDIFNPDICEFIKTKIIN